VIPDIFLTSLPLAISFNICYHPNHMTASTFPRTTLTTISQDVAARKAARRKVIEQAQQLERESYKAMMQKRRQLHTSTTLDTIM
jgi:hypothetical protein